MCYAMMAGELKIGVGQHSSPGRKSVNQDFHGVCFPKQPLLGLKGIAVALADGISSSEVSQIASETAIKGFLDDYYCTPESWSVRTSVQRVLTAINSWLHSQNQQSHYRHDRDRGFVCTLSALVIKSTTAYLFNVGDTRIYRLRKGVLEQLTEDHRQWMSQQHSYLSRALGVTQQVEIDCQSIPLETNDVFLLLTDGVYEHVSPQSIVDCVSQYPSDLNTLAHHIVQSAVDHGSDDNLTVQIVRIDELPDQEAAEALHRLSCAPLPPQFVPRMEFDGYVIIRELHFSHRSHIYLATDKESGIAVALKVPSVDLQNDAAHLERFMMEEWIARRINSAHVLKPFNLTRKRNFLYLAMEYVEGITLSQWMVDNPRPELESVRNIVTQIAKGLTAFHRMEMLHQDLRPENIIIDNTGTVRIIDFGSVRIAGITEIQPGVATDILGTVQYAAPEYFLGESGSTRSDLFSLGVITYQMLSGRLPFGARVPKARSRSAQLKLVYDSVLNADSEVPVWIDGVLRKAVHPDPLKRYEELSEFVYDLRHPDPKFLSRTMPPLLERNPVRFWKGVSLILLILILLLLHIKSVRP